MTPLTEASLVTDMRANAEIERQILWTFACLAERIGLTWNGKLYSLDSPQRARVIVHYVTTRISPLQRVNSEGVDIIIKGSSKWEHNQAIESEIAAVLRLLLKGPPSQEGRSTPIVIDADVLHVTYWLLTLQDENRIASLDEKGRTDIEERKLHTRELVALPIVDMIAEYVKTLLGDIPVVPLWQDGKRLTAIISHDVDVLNHASFISGLIALQRSLRWHRSYASFIHYWKQALTTSKVEKNRVFQFIERVVKFETKLAVRSTWYLFGAPWKGHYIDLMYDLRIQPGIRNVVKDLVAQTFEIGLHSSVRSIFDPHQLPAERQRIESVTGVPCYGVRQHELAGQASSRTTAISCHDFRYDTSIGFNHAIGFRSGISTPYTPYSSKNSQFLELPLSLLDNSAAASAEWAGKSVAQTGLELLRAVEKVGGMVVLDWHPHVWDQSAYPGWSEAYEELLQTAAQRNAWIARAIDVADWWLQRRKALGLDGVFERLSAL